MDDEDCGCCPTETLSPADIQRNYFANLPSCDWVKYDHASWNYLLQNIGFALFGPPDTEGELHDLGQNDKEQLQGYNSRQTEMVFKIFNKIREQTRFSRTDDIVMSILLIVCASPKPLKLFEKKPSDFWLDLHMKTDCNVVFKTVFKIRKCIPLRDKESACKLFIDENARVYKTWNNFLKNNTLHECVVVAPKNGEYKAIKTGEDNFDILLDVVPSPALGIGTRVLSVSDTLTSLVAFGTIGVMGAAALLPVSAAVVSGAAIASATVGVYSIVRSTMHLKDRKKHEQSIHIKDEEARGSWLNVATSGFGIVSCAASGLLFRSAAAGTNMTKTGQILSQSVSVLQRATLAASSAGLAHSLFYLVNKYRKHKERPTPLEMFQFASSTLFLFNAVVSNKTAQSIIEEAQAAQLNEYKSSLRSNNLRRIFDKITAEARRLKGDVVGNTEVIRGIKVIANKDQFFSDVLKFNKEANQANVRISLTSDGQVNLNGQYKFEPSQLRGIGKEARSELFTKIGPANLTAPNATKITPSNISVTHSMLKNIHPGEVLQIGMFVFKLSQMGVEEIYEKLENLSEEVYDMFMTIVLNVISSLKPTELGMLEACFPDSDIVSRVVVHFFNYFKSQRPFGEVNEDDNAIINIMRDFFQDGKVSKERIMQLKCQLLSDVEIEEKKLKLAAKTAIVCDICEGIRYSN